MSCKSIGKLAIFFVLAVFSAALADINWTEHVIDDDFEDAWGVYICDFDNDGDMDIIGCSKEDGIAGYENDGMQNFEKVVQDNTIGSINAIEAVDFDGDGLLDILAAGEGHSNDGIVAWYHNNDSLSFTRYDITTDLEYCQHAEAKDIDSDGDIDILACGSWSYEIVWFENDGEQVFTRHSIIDDYGYSYFATAVDFDLDEDIDIVAAGAYEDITWFENDGDENFTAHDISDLDTCFSASLAIADLNNDGDLDIIAPDLWQDKVFAFINLGGMTFSMYTIDHSYNGVYDVAVADINNDGFLDITGAAWDDAMVSWWENISDSGYVRHDLTDEYPRARRARPADINGDGALDIVATCQQGDKLAWWENDLYTSIPADDNKLPENVSLLSAYPNPFNATTTISFDLNNPQQTRLDIYDIQGRKITTLLNEYKQAGHYNVHFDASEYASGVYLYRLQAGDYSESKRVVLLK